MHPALKGEIIKKNICCAAVSSSLLRNVDQFMKMTIADLDFS